MFFFAPPPPQVSFSADVAPILAMRCNSCHGDAGGLNTRTHAGLMAGSNLGKIVIPGDAERSLLVHFIDGRRGELHRMPLGGRPLSQEEIGIIRRWIDDGARPDSATLPRHVFTLNRISLPRGKPLRLFFQVSTDAYLTLTIRDPKSRRVLFSQVATVKPEREQGDAGSPGELLHWDIHAGKSWPTTIDAELAAEHGTSALRDTQFYVAPPKTSNLWRSPFPVTRRAFASRRDPSVVRGSERLYRIAVLARTNSAQPASARTNRRHFAEHPD